MLTPLPIDEVLPDLIQALESHPNAVLKAPTGAGKTTRVPPALLDAGLAGETGRIVMLEPRRLAARAAARRMAEEHGWTVGKTVGYQVRFDKKAGKGTRILVVTEGLLVRLLQADPFLDGVSVVIFDEIHERNLDTDLALALARRVQQEARDDLRLVAMSATLDPGPVAEFLGDAPLVESEGRLHPVEIEYEDASGPRGTSTSTTGSNVRPWQIAQRTVQGVRKILDQTSGDVLAFLPGVGEIHRAAKDLADLERQGIAVVPLHGSLPPREQDRALTPLPGRRRVILSTNVAESSVTVPGVTAVVDSGFARVLRSDAATGLDRLELTRISKESADQRAGRAGREQPGKALRLWSAHDHRSLPDREPPEIARVDLTRPMLELMAWGESDPTRFEWLEAPPLEAQQQALGLLEMLGARGPQGLTALGRTLASLPVHPRLARLLVEGHCLGATREAALAAALLSERDPVRIDRDGELPPPSFSDLQDRIEALERFDRSGRPPGWLPGRFHKGTARFVLKARDQLLRETKRRLGSRGSLPEGGPQEAVGRALLAAYPDRLVKRREPGDDRGVMVGGRGVVLAPECAVKKPELLLAVELSAGIPGVHAEALVRKAAGVERSWLPDDLLKTDVDVSFDPERQRVIASRRTRFRDLVIDEAEVPAPADAAGRVLAQAAADDPARALDLERRPVADFLTRLRFLADARPELDLPTFDDEALRRLLPALAAGKRSFAELRRAPLLDVLKGSLSFDQLQTLERDAPERLEVPSGNRIRLDYEPGRPPILAVRIQEMFGATETPRVAGGRVPVTLHLLAPNMRPQQITDDLAGFWERTYPEVKKELAGRYPKHAWPDDPVRARPQYK